MKRWVRWFLVVVFSLNAVGAALLLEGSVPQANPAVELCFYNADEHRQVRIEGTVEMLDDLELKDVYIPARLLVAKVRRSGMAGVERALEVDVHDRIPVAFIHAEHQFVTGNARIIYQNIHGLQSRNQILKKSVNRFE